MSQARRRAADVVGYSRLMGAEEEGTLGGTPRHAREGETCWSIVDAVRADLARRYVEDKGRSLGEISDLLGCSNLSSFSRWFRAKFASSPMIWRAGNGGRSGPPFSASS